MPGICVSVTSTPTAGLTTDLDRMLQSMRHHAWYQVHAHTDSSSGGALGCVTLDGPGDDGRPACSQDGSSIAVLAGELYEPEKAWAELGLGSRPEVQECSAAWLLNGYQCGGEEFLR